ncbi:MAG: radical SAM protein [Cryomorphaceae bacterium]
MNTLEHKHNLQASPADPTNAYRGKVHFAWLELTEKCNLACAHCYVSSSPAKPLHAKMQSADWIKVMTELKAKGCDSIQFIGGEPFIHPALPTFLEKAHQLGFGRVEVFSNLTHHAKIDWADLKAKGVRLATSFYSRNSTVHASIVRNDRAFNLLLFNLLEALRYSVPLRIEITDLGLPNQDIAGTLNFLHHLGISRANVKVNRLQSNGRARSIGVPEGALKDDLCGQCWKGKLCFTNTGTVFPCIMARSYPVGNALQDGGLSALLGSHTLDETRSSLAKAFGNQGHGSEAQFSACGPQSDACGPDNCGPNDAACGPDNCGPNDAACGPDNCGPSDADVGCGPDNCGPNDAACGPDNCGPNDAACGPDNCGPNDAACGPDNNDHCGPALDPSCGPSSPLPCGPSFGGGGGNCGPGAIDPGPPGLGE